MAFTREQRRLYDKAKRQGLTDRAIAENWGISRSTLSRVKNTRGRLADRTVDRIFGNLSRTTEDRRGDSVIIRASADDFISYDELKFLKDNSNNTRTIELARREIDRIQRELGITSVDDPRLRDVTVPRPTFTRTIQGRQITIPLGRSKSDEFQRKALKDLRARGVDVDRLFKDREYADLGGYGGLGGGA